MSSTHPQVGPSLAEVLERLKATESANNISQLVRLAKSVDETTKPILFNLLRNRGYPELATEGGIELLARCA